MTTPQTIGIKAGTAAGTWTIELPLVESEQFDTTTNQGGEELAMRTMQVSITRRGRDNPARFVLLGPEIHPSGSRGSGFVGRLTDADEFSSRCPQTMYLVVNAADELVERIRSDAERAVEEIRSALGPRATRIGPQ